jgi:Methyltransferase domain
LNDRFEIMQRAASLAPADGLILEFGVAHGYSLRVLAELMRPRRVFGFDSFAGLPERWGPYPAGHFAGRPKNLPRNVELVEGLFADTIAPFLAAHPGNVALMHVDCDLYASAKTVFAEVAHRIVRGTVILLDEFWIEIEHEQRAFGEFLIEQSRECRFDSRTAEQACVVMSNGGSNADQAR